MASEEPRQDNVAGEVLFRIEGGVSTITLNHPDRLNAMSARMDKELRERVREADANPSCVAVCITGAGKGFCSGADLSGPGVTANELLPYKLEPGSLAEFRFGYLTECRKPVIAALNGPAVGVGLVLAAFCDVRIASSRAKLGFTYSRVGLVAEYGIAWWLPKLIGIGASHDLLLSGRLVDGSEARQLGLVDHLVDEADFSGHVAGYMRQLVDRCSPQSMAVIKRQLWDAHEESLLEAIAAGNRALQTARAAGDYAEGRVAFAAKRQPLFAKLD